MFVFSSLAFWVKARFLPFLFTGCLVKGVLGVAEPLLWRAFSLVWETLCFDWLYSTFTWFLGRLLLGFDWGDGEDLLFWLDATETWFLLIDWVDLVLLFSWTCDSLFLPYRGWACSGWWVWEGAGFKGYCLAGEIFLPVARLPTDFSVPGGE